MDYCSKDIVSAENPKEVEEDSKGEADFLEKKRKHNKKNAIKKYEIEEFEENPTDCHFFYQASSGENLFLHPLCLKIFQNEHPDILQYPTQIEGPVAEINYAVVD